MAPRLPGLTAALLLALLLPCPIRAQTPAPDSAPERPQAPGPAWRQVITAQEIGRAGMFRLGDVLRLADGWDLATIDEYTWRATPPSLAAPTDDGWTVLVDGVPVETGILGVTTLERLPLDLQIVDSVELTTAPRLASGVFAARGLVRVFTRRAPAGASVRGRFATGSETGDAGPFEFASPEARNHDRYGHEASLGASYGAPGWHASAGLALGVHVPTDPAIVSRYVTVEGARARIERSAPWLRIGVGGPRSAHSALVGRSELDDWFRADGFGAELPARSTLDHAGATGSFPVGGSRLRYRLAYESNRIHSTLRSVEPPLELRSTLLRADVEMPLGLTAGGGFLGAGVTHRDLATDYPLEDDPGLTARLFGGAAWPVAASVEQRVELLLEAGGGELGGGVVLEQHWQAASRDLVSLAVAASRTLNALAEEPADLVLRGYGWLEDAGVPLTVAGRKRPGWELAVDAAWRRDMGAISLWAAGSHRTTSATFLAASELAFDPERRAWRGPVRLESARRAHTGTARVGAEAEIANGLTGRASYTWRWLLAGDDEVEELQERTPRHAARLQLTYVPVAGFSLWARADFRGATQWAEYREVEELTGGAIRYRTPDVLTVDAAVQKLFWDGRVHARLGLRNLFDAEARYHPEGGTASRAFFLGVGGALGR